MPIELVAALDVHARVEGLLELLADPSMEAAVLLRRQKGSTWRSGTPEMTVARPTSGPVGLPARARRSARRARARPTGRISQDERPCAIRAVRASAVGP